MSEPNDPVPEEVRERHVVNAADARDQASEGGYGFLRSEFRRDNNGEVWEIPHKDLFDSDQQDRWDDLLDELRGYDREPDVTAADGTVVRRGNLVQPHHKNGKRVRPSWPERLAIVLWGKEGAARAKTGGINFNEIELIWGKQAEALTAKRLRDSKSVPGDSGMAPASG